MQEGEDVALWDGEACGCRRFMSVLLRCEVTKGGSGVCSIEVICSHVIAYPPCKAHSMAQYAP